MGSVNWEQRPQLRRPAMICAFKGWNDAAESATTALRYLATQWDAERFAAIDHVSPASRAVLLLHYQHDLSIEETAIVLDIPVGTAKSRLAYGISVLRKLITQKGTQ